MRFLFNQIINEWLERCSDFRKSWTMQQTVISIIPNITTPRTSIFNCLVPLHFLMFSLESTCKRFWGGNFFRTCKVAILLTGGSPKRLTRWVIRSNKSSCQAKCKKRAIVAKESLRKLHLMDAEISKLYSRSHVTPSRSRYSRSAIAGPFETPVVLTGVVRIWINACLLLSVVVIK